MNQAEIKASTPCTKVMRVGSDTIRDPFIQSFLQKISSSLTRLQSYAKHLIDVLNVRVAEGDAS